MNKLQEDKILEKTVDSIEEQQILADAENIILKFNEDEKIKKSKKRIFFVLLPLLILILLILLFSTIFALLNINNNNIINGISIQGIDVSGLSIDDARTKVNSYFDSQLSKELILNHNDYSITIVPSQFGGSFDVDLALDTAYSIGRNDNIFKNNYTILSALNSTIDVGVNVSYDTSLLGSILTQINSELPDRVIQPNYSIEDSNLIIYNGINGICINEKLLTSELFVALLKSTDDIINLDIPVNNITANPIDISSIYSEIHKDAVDAYYTTDPYVVHPSSNGFDFAITLDEATNIISVPQEEYVIPLKILYPNVTTDQIGPEAFPDLLAEFNTSFVSSNANRSTNIRLAASKINGKVLMPGETFSYNQTVGRRTAAAGFKEAPAYLNGEVITEYGGGVCQVSSTLYNAVLLANLEVTERLNHSFKPTYVKPGLDATVSWGGPDFKFKNNRSYPIKIIVTTENKIVYFKIFGLKSDSDLKVVLHANIISTVYAKTVYKTDPSLATGVSKVTQKASNGCKTKTYKILYDASENFISKILISNDTYNAHNQTIAVGP